MRETCEISIVKHIQYHIATHLVSRRLMTLETSVTLTVIGATLLRVRASRGVEMVAAAVGS